MAAPPFALLAGVLGTFGTLGGIAVGFWVQAGGTVVFDLGAIACF